LPDARPRAINHASELTTGVRRPAFVPVDASGQAPGPSEPGDSRRPTSVPRPPRRHHWGSCSAQLTRPFRLSSHAAIASRPGAGPHHVRTRSTPSRRNPPALDPACHPQGGGEPLRSVEDLKFGFPARVVQTLSFPTEAINRSPYFVCGRRPVDERQGRQL